MFLGLPALLLCHGSPEDLRGWAAERPDDARRWLEEADAGALICAHTHRPSVAAIEGRLIVNAGSVGLSEEPGQAQFALLTGENGAWRAEIARAPYDVERTVSEFSEDGFREAAGLWPVMVEKQLREGGNPGVSFVARAYALWTGPGPIPEDIWRRAARETGII